MTGTVLLSRFIHASPREPEADPVQVGRSGAAGARRARQPAWPSVQIGLVPLPSYSPDFMPVEALWRWLREDVTYHHCHRSAEDLSRRVAAFEARLNRDPCTVADRLSVKERLDPEEEKLRFSS